MNEIRGITEKILDDGTVLYKARITHNYVNYQLGTYTIKSSAVKARKRAENIITNGGTQEEIRRQLEKISSHKNTKPKLFTAVVQHNGNEYPVGTYRTKDDMLAAQNLAQEIIEQNPNASQTELYEKICEIQSDDIPTTDGLITYQAKNKRVNNKNNTGISNVWYNEITKQYVLQLRFKTGQITRRYDTLSEAKRDAVKLEKLSKDGVTWDEIENFFANNPPRKKTLAELGKMLDKNGQRAIGICGNEQAGRALNATSRQIDTILLDDYLTLSPEDIQSYKIAIFYKVQKIKVPDPRTLGIIAYWPKQ